MNEAEKKELLDNFRAWWRDELAVAHKSRTLMLTELKNLTINPFAWSYLAYFLEGKADPETLAKVLVYPRALGTSFVTIFGTRFQNFITRYFRETYGSNVDGVDIEFTDKIDGKRKYCQLKAGPNVVNYDDVETIKNHFLKAIRTGKQNGAVINSDDYVFCLLYGEEWEKNGFVRKIEKDYTVWAGKDFWYHFTGDKDFYADLIQAVGEIANEFDMKEVVDEVIAKLADDIKKTYPDLVSQ